MNCGAGLQTQIDQSMFNLYFCLITIHQKWSCIAYYFAAADITMKLVCLQKYNANDFKKSSL